MRRPSIGTWTRAGLLASAALFVACATPYAGDSLDGPDPSLPPRSAKETGSTTEAKPTTASKRDAGVEASTDASTDAPTAETKTFTLGETDCGGGHCGGGYDGAKTTGNLPTADKQCVDRGFTRATDFTIGGQPGGRFCNFNGTQYGCDPSCDGCNVMATITCVRP